MGIDHLSADFLRACRKAGVAFDRTITLGRQQMLDGDGYAEPFLVSLGADQVESIDASAYEGATVIADLNAPLEPSLRRRFSAVLDIGTLEHVFDIGIALRSAADLVEAGGHYVAVSPANNWPGHGFYQFSPELLYRVFCADAGFRVRGAFVVEHRRRPRWYQVPDPAAVGMRMAWRNCHRTSLFVLAERTELRDLDGFVPQQSDYQARWSVAEGDASTGPSSGVKAAVWGLAPGPIRRFYEAAVRRRREHFDRRAFVRVSPGRLHERVLPIPARP